MLCAVGDAGKPAGEPHADIHPLNGAVTRGLGTTLRSARLERPTVLSRHGASESKPRLVHSTVTRTVGEKASQLRPAR